MADADPEAIHAAAAPALKQTTIAAAKANSLTLLPPVE
jgi:hypothetical protein